MISFCHLEFEISGTALGVWESLAPGSVASWLCSVSPSECCKPNNVIHHIISPPGVARVHSVDSYYDFWAVKRPSSKGLPTLFLTDFN